MKPLFTKLTAVVFLLILTFTLASCAEGEDETFQINNLTISKIIVSEGENIIYNSEHNLATENTSLFSEITNHIKAYDMTETVSYTDTCDSNRDTFFEITSTQGVIEIKTVCFDNDGNDKLMTVISTGSLIIGYTEDELFSDLEEALN